MAPKPKSCLISRSSCGCLVLLVLFILSQRHYLGISCYRHRPPPLPPFESADCIQVRASGYGVPIMITDPLIITKAMTFANLYLDGWEHSFAIAPVDIEFYRNREFMGSLGIAEQFITRIYGGFLAKDLPPSETLRFASSSHPALHEGIFPVIPPGTLTNDLIRETQSNFRGISPGVPIASIYEHISDIGGRITADHPTFIDISLVTLNVGEYADTVIAGQYQLDEERNLTKRLYFGVFIVRKTVRTAVGERRKTCSGWETTSGVPKGS